MKKKLLVYVLLGCLGVSLAACGKKSEKDNTDTVSTEEANETTTESSDSTESSEVSEGDFSYKDIDGYSFSFCSGAGAWSTDIVVNSDGTFSGDYHDSEMGDTGENYSNGTVYLCKFEGSFGSLTKVDDLTYKTTITDISFSKKEDTVEYSDDVRYVYTYAYGLDNAKDIYFYLKGSKVSDLPEGYVEWLRGKIDVDESDATLPFIGIYNENAEAGFAGNEVSTEEETSDEGTSGEGASVTKDEYYEKFDACVAQAEEIEYSLEHDDLTQTEINFKARDLYDLWDGHLNYLWGVLKASLSEDEMAKLTTEEKQWISEKEAAMDAAAAEYEGGSIQPYIYHSKGAELTKKRVEELQNYLK